MKKHYLQPEVQITTIEPMTIICLSNLGLGGSGDPTGARAPIYDGD